MSLYFSRKKLRRISPALLIIEDNDVSYFLICIVHADLQHIHWPMHRRIKQFQHDVVSIMFHQEMKVSVKSENYLSLSRVRLLRR